MTFLPYENVPLYLSEKGKEGKYIFAEKASLNLNQSVQTDRQIDDNIIQIASYSDGSTINYSEHTFLANQETLITLGPIDGPPRPIATSIDLIEKDSKITFPNGKHLYFSDDIKPLGSDYVIKVYSKSGGWSLDEEEAQNGFFFPDLAYSAKSPIEGSLDVDFYLNTGNMPNFFNITGLADPTQYPPISNEVITGFLGDFAFHNAYLSSFSFSVAANSIIQASASFQLYGLITKDTKLSQNYYSSDLYRQQSIPHGETSKIVGINALGMDHATSFSYSATINRVPKYSLPEGEEIPEFGFVPSRVSKRETNISISIEGSNIDPAIINKASKRENVEVSCELYDLSYENYKNNSAGFMQKFQCNGMVDSESVFVNSLGFLEGSFSITKNIQ